MSGSYGKTSVGIGLGLTKAILDPSSFERFHVKKPKEMVKISLFFMIFSSDLY